MDGPRFDAVLQRVARARSRRGALAALLGGGLGVLGATSEAKHKKQKRHKKPAPPTGCVRNCAGKTCGDDGCGGSCGACGACQSCQGGTCRNRCTSAQTCLTNGSCALTCPNGSPSDPACDAFGAPCSCRALAEGGSACRFSQNGCLQQPSCTSSADCPPSRVCIACDTPTNFRCMAICGYQCTNDAECGSRLCQCGATNTEGNRFCEAIGECGGAVCTASSQCGSGKHCSVTTCGPGGSAEHRCVDICATGTVA